MGQTGRGSGSGLATGLLASTEESRLKLQQPPDLRRSWASGWPNCRLLPDRQGWQEGLESMLQVLDRRHSGSQFRW